MTSGSDSIQSLDSFLSPLPHPAPSLDDMQLALSRIAFREYRPRSPPTLHTRGNKHLEFLNLLSPLLVTGSQGDGAAVMFRFLSKERLELHYAKNRPCTDKENKYIRDIFSIISRDEKRDCHFLCWDILSLVITECKRKIKSRTRKLCHRLREISAPSSAPYASASFAICGGACTAKSENSLRKVLGQSVFPLTGTMPQLLCAWFIHLLRESHGEVGRRRSWWRHSCVCRGRVCLG